MSESLKPTLWRTARALNNVDRLNLLRLVDGAKGVRGVVRSGSFVYYGTGSDRTYKNAVVLSLGSAAVSPHRCVRSCDSAALQIRCGIISR